MWPEFHHHYRHHHLVRVEPLKLRPTQMSVGLVEVTAKRRECSEIPLRLTQLQDDPYRTLANRVHEAGGYAKSAAPYAEFLWADFLRARVGAGSTRRASPEAVRSGVKLARSSAARYLPGWAGPRPRP